MKLAACRVKLWSGNGGSGRERAMHPVREGGNGPSGSERDCQQYRCQGLGDVWRGPCNTRINLRLSNKL